MKLLQGDCLDKLKEIEPNSVALVLTDIPYGECNRGSNGLRKLDKEKADIMTFNLQEFLNECYRICKGTIIIFCGQGQFSGIQIFFDNKQKKQKGTVRQIIWHKSNPSPMNGQHIYLSGIENAVWFKKRGGTFTAHCKNTVFKHPSGRSKLHPTEKNHKLLEELILDNSNEGDLVLDPCCGSGSHLLVAKNLNRNAMGIELSSEYMKICEARLGVKADIQGEVVEQVVVAPVVAPVSNTCECGGIIKKIDGGRCCESCLKDYLIT